MVFIVRMIFCLLIWLEGQAFWAWERHLFIFSACGLLGFAAFQGWSMHSYSSQPFYANRCWLDEWKFVTTAGENNSCSCVSHQGRLCAWRTVYYVEGINQGINWKGIEAWMELGSLSFRDTAHVFLFTWWLRSKFPVCDYSVYQEAKV